MNLENQSIVSKKIKHLLKGILKVHPRGFAFLQPENPIDYPQDIFIPKHATAHAVDGDTVEVELLAHSAKGPEGAVVAILKRSRSHVAGTVIQILNPNEALVHAPLLGTAKPVVVYSEDPSLMQLGDRLIMKVLEWNDATGQTRCLRVNWIGNISTPTSDISAAIEEFELRQQFPTAAIEQAQAHGSRIPLKEIKKRRDLRDLECITIDPDTAKDYDDALNINHQNGHWELGVHIADVSYYVTKGSALDEEAKARANSTYFPGECIPMLPHELSNELCSLKPKVNRLTVSVLMRFDAHGTLIHHEICRSVIRSKKRFTYKEAKQVLDGKKSSPHQMALKRMMQLCQLLKKQRQIRGSVEFCLPETVIHTDSEGAPTHLEKIEYDVTHQMVEEFMLKANEVIATHLAKLDRPLTYRVHEAPAPESVDTFCQLARAFGFSLPKDPEPRDFQELFEQAIGSQYFSQLAVSFIRSMKLAFYSTANDGHYGLSLAYYCHFTSPIRRYIDLVVHRILLEEPEELSSLSEIAYHCSEKERISARAEQSVILLKKLRLLEREIAKDPKKVFKAMITRVKGTGILFEVTGWALEGFLPLFMLPYHSIQFDPKLLVLASPAGHKWHCGQEIEVQVQSINLITSEALWQFPRQARAEHDTKKDDSSHKKAKKNSRRRKRR